MRAFIQHRYGSPLNLKLEEVPTPELTGQQIRVRIRANSVNPADWHTIRGTPLLARLSLGFFKPANKIPGGDFAGEVEAVGPDVHDVKVGDRVFGEALGIGAFADYTCVPPSMYALMPAGLMFSTMACIPVAGLTALQALITHGNLKSGESVLINGASGGVGHFCVQIARAHGAVVTAICSARNEEFVRSIGADRVIPYDRIHVSKLQDHFDLLVDACGNLRFTDYKRLANRGVMVGFTSLSRMGLTLLGKTFSRYQLDVFTARPNRSDLDTLASLVQQGKIQPHIEQTYSYRDIPKAVCHIESMRTRGKVAVGWNEANGPKNVQAV